MQNLATSAAYCETRFVVDSERYNVCLKGFLNLGLISGVADNIADFNACATTEEQAYCVSKAKSYGIFTGVNGNAYNRCIADICAAKEPELVNQSELTNLVGGITATAIGVGILTPTVIAAEILTPLNLGLISGVADNIADFNACATTEEQAYCVSKAKSYGIFTGVNGNAYNRCIADICAAKEPELTNLGFFGDALNGSDSITIDAKVDMSIYTECLMDCGIY